MKDIIDLILKYLPFLIQASASVPQVIEFLAEFKAIMQRTEIWTDEQEKAFDQGTKDMRNDPAWQINDPPTEKME